MSISHNDAATSTDYAFPVFNDVPIGPVLDNGVHVSQWPGTYGETHFVQGPFGGEIRVEVEFAGAAASSPTTYSTQAALMTVVRTIQAKQGRIHGKLTIDGVEYEQCTFLRYEERERFYEGAGVRGWISSGTLIWRQANLDAPPAP